MKRVLIRGNLTLYEHLFGRNSALVEAIKDMKQNEKSSNKGKKSSRVYGRSK